MAEKGEIDLITGMAKKWPKKGWTERDDGGKGSGKEKVAENQPIIKQNVKKKDDRVE